MIRVVVDANVLLAGVVSPPESPPALLLNALEHGRLEAIACPRLLQQLHHGLDKPFLPIREPRAKAEASRFLTGRPDTTSRRADRQIRRSRRRDKAAASRDTRRAAGIACDRESRVPRKAGRDPEDG